MRINLLTATMLATIFATAASADEFPARKPGLWVVTVQNDGTTSATMKMCIDAATDQLFHKFSNNIRAKHCAKNDIKVTGDVVTEDSDCTLGGTKVTSSAITRYTGNSAYHVDIDTHFSPPKLGKDEVKTVQDAKWTGDCPINMKPGDFDMGHGIRINIKTLNMLRSLLPGHHSQ